MKVVISKKSIIIIIISFIIFLVFIISVFYLIPRYKIFQIEKEYQNCIKKCTRNNAILEPATKAWLLCELSCKQEWKTLHTK